MLIAILLAVALLASCDAIDQTDQKRGPYGSYPGASQTPVPQPSNSSNAVGSGNSSSSSANNSSNSSSTPSSTGTARIVKAANGCDMAVFNNNLNGDVAKDLTQIISVSVRAKGALAIDLSESMLKLNLGINNLSVTPAIAQGEVTKEMDRVKGERKMFLADASQLEKVKAKGGAWNDQSCMIGMVSTYSFPYGPSTTIKVSFDPALPFAAFPNAVTAEGFAGKIGTGLAFDAITGKVTEVSGTATPDIKVGDTATGKVQVTKAGNGYKFAYEFGNFQNMKKLGLFNSATYSYTPSNIQTVELVSPVQEGRDSITILFK
jgi:hypothetical protein